MTLSLSNILTLMATIKLVSAELKEPTHDIENWTSCEEFVNNTKLDPDRLVDIDWKIFFFWTPEYETSYNVKFRRPSQVLIDRFRVELDKELVPPANWSNTELFMETVIDFSALLLNTSKPGIYRLIPSIAIEYKVQTPLLLFAFKLVEPGYLGISSCKHRLCYALAPADKMPYHYELEKAAKSLKFYSPLNHTHIAPPPEKTSGIPYAADFPHDEQLEDVDIDKDMSETDFLSMNDF